MLNKIIHELEQAKKYQIPHIEAGIEIAIEIIKKYETPFDGLIEPNEQDQGKYVSLVDLQEFIFNTCNVEDNTIFIDFHNYLQFLERQRSLPHPPTT